MTTYAFTAADSTTTLPAGWTQNSGTWGIVGNKAYCSSAADDSIATVDTGLVNMDVQAVVTLGANPGPGWCLILSYVDSLNYIELEVASSGSMIMYQRLAGSYSQISDVGTAATGDTIRATRTNGNQYTIYRNGSQVLQSDTTRTAHATATRAGMRQGSSGTGLRWDDFTHTDPAGGGSLNNLIVNPSFETTTEPWMVRFNCTIQRVAVAGAPDGAHAMRLTAQAAGDVDVQIDTLDGRPDVSGGTPFVYSVSIKPTVTRNAAVFVEWIGVSGAAGSATTSCPANAWTRVAMTATTPAGTTEARPVIRITELAAGEQVDVDAVGFYLNSTNPAYQGPVTGSAAPTVSAAPGTTVAAGTGVTLIGAPAGGTWSQDSGDVVVLSTPTSSSTDTRVALSAANSSTTTTSVRVFRYTVGSQSTPITITAQAASSGGGSSLVTEPFPGTAGTAWPAGWTITAGGGATVGQATQQGGRGRMAVPALNGYPGIAATRRDVVVADFEAAFTVHGAVTTTSAATAEHYRELFARLRPSDNPATGISDGLVFSIYPSSSDPVNSPWCADIYRRRNGVTTRLGSSRHLAAATRDIKVRVKATGDRLQMRAWAVGAAEPNVWHVDVTDTAPEKITAAGSIALVGFGGQTATANTIEWDDVDIVAAVGAPTVTITTPNATTIWDDPIPLTAIASGATALAWSVVSGPNGGGGTFSAPTAATTTFTPTKAGGLYVLRVTASNFSSSTTAEVSVDVRAQMWQKTATGKRPVRIMVNAAT